MILLQGQKKIEQYLRAVHKQTGHLIDQTKIDSGVRLEPLSVLERPNTGMLPLVPSVQQCYRTLLFWHCTRVSVFFHFRPASSYHPLGTDSTTTICCTSCSFPKDYNVGEKLTNVPTCACIYVMLAGYVFFTMEIRTK